MWQSPAPSLPREKWNSGEAITVWKSCKGTNKHQRERRKKLGLPATVPLRQRQKEKWGYLNTVILLNQTVRDCTTDGRIHSERGITPNDGIRSD